MVREVFGGEGEGVVGRLIGGMGIGHGENELCDDSVKVILISKDSQVPHCRE
jgi:hypothetical protein